MAISIDMIHYLLSLIKIYLIISVVISVKYQANVVNNTIIKTKRSFLLLTFSFNALQVPDLKCHIKTFFDFVFGSEI